MLKSQEESFYRGLDRLKQKRGFCNCQTMAVFFAFLLIASLLATFSFFKAVRFSPEEGSSPQVAANLDFASEIDLGGGAFEVIVSEAGFCSIITGGDEEMAKKITCHISEEGIDVVGRFGFWLPANSKVTIMPKAELGKISFEVVEVSVGKVKVPVSLAESFLKKSLGALRNTEQIRGAKIEDIELRQGLMVVRAWKEGEGLK